MTTCTICQTVAARPHHTTCQPCDTWTHTHLDHARQLLDRARDRLTPHRSADGPRVTGGPVEAPIPVSLDAIMHIMAADTRVIVRLDGHAQDLLRARGDRLSADAIDGQSERYADGILRALADHLPWALQAHDMHALALDLEGVCAELRELAAPATQKTLGRPCPHCAGALIHDREARAIRCDSCGHQLALATHSNTAATAARRGA